MRRDKFNDITAQKEYALLRGTVKKTVHSIGMIFIKATAL